MKREEFLAYIADYNSGDTTRIFRYFEADLIFENFGFHRRGAAAFAFLLGLHEVITYRMEPIIILVDGDAIAMEADGYVTAKRDLPDLPIGAMSSGQSVKQRMFAFYTTAGSRIKHVRIAGWPPIPVVS